MSQEQQPINTENLHVLFHFSIQKNKNGVTSNHIQLEGNKMELMSELMMLLLAEPKIEKLLKETLKHSKNFKKFSPETVKDIRNQSSKKKSKKSHFEKLLEEKKKANESKQK